MLPCKPAEDSKPWRAYQFLGGMASRAGEPFMPTRRTMELVVVTVVLLHPVVSMARIWLAKHLRTSSNDTTTAAAEVAATIL